MNKYAYLNASNFISENLLLIVIMLINKPLIGEYKFILTFIRLITKASGDNGEMHTRSQCS